MPDSNDRLNKYRVAYEQLQRGRDRFVDELADEVLDRGDDLIDTPFLLNEFLESQGTRLHFLGLLMAQLEQSAETLEMQEAEALRHKAALEEQEHQARADAPTKPSRSRSGTKKLGNQRATSHRKRNADEG
jgi:hypothetical protein